MSEVWTGLHPPRPRPDQPRYVVVVHHLHDGGTMKTHDLEEKAAAQAEEVDQFRLITLKELAEQTRVAQPEPEKATTRQLAGAPRRLMLPPCRRSIVDLAKANIIRTGKVNIIPRSEGLFFVDAAGRTEFIPTTARGRQVL